MSSTHPDVPPREAGPSGPTRKELLALKYAERPLMRVLIYTHWFRLAFLFVVVGFLVVLLSVFRVWRTTPAGFLPIVKVSLVDLAQAWSLRRTALKLAAVGETEQAVFAWQRAIANNLADKELLRGSLRCFLQVETAKPRLAQQAAVQAAWLLRLSNTNRADVELAVQVYGKFDLPDFVLDLLTPREANLSPPAEMAYLKALFLAGDTDRFAARWKNAATRFGNDPELALFHAAYLAAWGPPDTQSQGRRFLEAACKDSPRQLLANRLQLRVCARALEADAYAQALARLAEWRADRLPDHVRLWHLLAMVGRKAEAKQLARDYVHPHLLPWEAAVLAQAYDSLGLQEHALRFLQRQAPELGDSDAPWAAGLWTLYADLLIQNRQWDELLSLAMQIRLTEKARIPLLAFSHFLEGKALHSLNRRTPALAAFQNAAKLPFHTTQMATQAALDLMSMGYPTIAWEILQPLEKSSGNSRQFWQALFDAAYLNKEEDVLFRAAAKAYELQSANPVCQNNYAAALLIHRQRLDEACKLTLALLGRNPDSLIAKVNHCFALAMNRRTAEAEALLRTANPDPLNELGLTIYHLNWFEIHFDQGQFDRAWDDLAHVNAKYLFPKQTKWLEQMRKRLPPRSNRPA